MGMLQRDIVQYKHPSGPLELLEIEELFRPMIDTNLDGHTSWSRIYLAIAHNYFTQYGKVQYESECWRLNTLTNNYCGKSF